jgi:hypothetical protein
LDPGSASRKSARGVSFDLDPPLSLFVPTGRIIQARHAVPGRDLLESARPEGTLHAGEMPLPAHGMSRPFRTGSDTHANHPAPCAGLPGFDERSRWDQRFLRLRWARLGWRSARSGFRLCGSGDGLRGSVFACAARVMVCAGWFSFARAWLIENGAKQPPGGGDFQGRFMGWGGRSPPLLTATPKERRNPSAEPMKRQ